MKTKMKYTIKAALLAFAMFALVPQCSNFLDKEQDVELTLDEVFTERGKMENWLRGVYSLVPRSTWEFWRQTCWNVMSDEAKLPDGWQPWWTNEINFFWGARDTKTKFRNFDDGKVCDYWTNMPQQIRRAYIFMENVKPIPASGIDEAEVALMKLECRFLAAYYWYLWVNTYGAIPFRPNYITPVNATIAEMQQGQTPYDSVINWLDNELLELSKLLPAKYENVTKYGRATSIMCLAVRARMLLFAASPLVNAHAADYDDYTNDMGEVIFNPVYDPDKWTRAANASKELIDAAEANGHALYKEFMADGTTIDPFMSCQNLFLKSAQQGNTEGLFVNPEKGHYDYQKHATPKRAGGNNALGVVQEFVDAFFMKDGKPPKTPEYENANFPVAMSSLYAEDSAATSDDVRDTKWNGGKELTPINPNRKIVAMSGAWKMYHNREPRFYLSVLFHKGWYPNPGKINPFQINFLNIVDNDHDRNESAHDNPRAGYLVRKMCFPTSNIDKGQYEYNPCILYRLGEAYLNYAEALNESAQRDPAIVLQYLNAIRERAGIRKYSTSEENDEFIKVNDTKEDFRKIIRAERRIELALEGIRFDDLRRWKTAQAAINKQFHGMDISKKTDAEYHKRVNAEKARIFRDAYYWMPIDDDDIADNPKLVQLPYW